MIPVDLKLFLSVKELLSKLFLTKYFHMNNYSIHLSILLPALNALIQYKCYVRGFAMNGLYSLNIIKEMYVPYYIHKFYL